MPRVKKEDTTTSEGEKLIQEWNEAWDALEPLRSTWDEKEKALLAQANDSVSGKITATRVSDAALSTLAFERQARVAAQLPTGRVYALNKSDDSKAKILNIVLNRYILPNADAQFDMLIKLRLWGVYASVYGSMPMFYDYRVDDRYIGPECYLLDPRCLGITPGFHSIQDAPAAYVLTKMSRESLEAILKRETTSYDKKAVQQLLDVSKDAKPSSDNDARKSNSTTDRRYDLSAAKNRIDIVTKYENDTWTSFATDYQDVPPIRVMDNPHKSGRKPIVMRHCFPLLNSLFGLGDYERGMKIQKAKDSILNLFLEDAKQRVFPPLMRNDSLLTPSSIKRQAGTTWRVKDVNNAVKAFSSGASPLNEFQGTYAALSSILQNQFGTSDTSLNQDNSGNPAFGKTPAALKLLNQRENARDTWDRFMHEKATEELLEGMLNLLTVKMEKPINFSVFEDDIKALGDTNDGLSVFSDQKSGKMTVAKKQISSETGYSYLIDANSSLKQDDQEQFQALMATWQLMHQLPDMDQRLAARQMEYDEADHIKAIFIAAGISDWEKILKELSQDKIDQMQAQQQQAQQQAQQQQMMQQQMMQTQAQPPQPPPPAPAGPPMQQMPPQMPQPPAQPQQQPGQMFEDPEIAAIAQQLGL